MSAIDRYLTEVAGELRVRGGVRRRFLRECGDHLADAAERDGERQAMRAFGEPAEIAAAFDAEVAAGRAVRSTYATAAGVLATAASTLVLIHASVADTAAPTGWIIAFFVAAQVAGVAAGLALLQALVLRRSPMPPAEVRLLTRRNGCALVAAAVTMFSAGAAATGTGSAALLLAGPALACLALSSVLRAWSLVRRLDGSASAAGRPPLEDLDRLLPVRLPSVASGRLVVVTAAAAAIAAFLRDRAEHAAFAAAMVTGAIEAAAVVVCALVLGRALGLWRVRVPPPPAR